MQVLRSIIINLFLLTLAATITSFTNGNEKPARRATLKWAVEKSSTLRIIGATNVNSFSCEVPGYYRPDTITGIDDPALKSVTLRGSLEIDINKFDCHHKIMTRDMRKTLKATQYPLLTIRFISLERIPDLKDNIDCQKGKIEIEIAGVCRRFDINYSFTRKGNMIELNGNRNFVFSDFSLDPPVKFGGLVKVKEVFNVDFKLLLNPLN